MNVTDLRDVLDERSSIDQADVLAHMMLDGVTRRILVRRRRRRLAAVPAAVVAVASLGAGTLLVNRQAAPGPAPAALPAVAKVDGFPEYALGAKVVAAGHAAAGASSMSLTFDPTGMDLVVFDDCTDSVTGYKISLNGREMTNGNGCGGAITTPIQSLIADSTIRVGHTATLVATGMKGPLPAGFGMAVGQKVDVTTYVFPPRPAVLKPLNPTYSNMGNDYDEGVEYKQTMLLRADPDDPNKPMSVKFTFGKGAILNLISQTPGVLDVSANGLRAAHGEWWDFEQGLVMGGSSKDWSYDPMTEYSYAGPGGKPRLGSSVQINVYPQRMTGDWAVAILEPVN